MTTVPVSIIMPCFNSEKTLARAIDSILRQTVMPTEVIAVDDASSDGTVAFLEDVKKNHPELNLKIIALKKNGGPATARNIAWESATEPYIAFIDSDDSWHPQKLEVQYNFMLSHPDAFLTGHLSQALASDATLPNEKTAETKSQIISATALLLSNKFLTRTVILKKEIPFRFKDDKRHSEDYLLWLQICLSNYRCYLLKNILAFSYKNDFGESGLSGQIFKMEMGELENFVDLLKKKQVNILVFCFVIIFSLAKFFKRLIVMGLRRTK